MPNKKVKRVENQSVHLPFLRVWPGRQEAQVPVK